MIRALAAAILAAISASTCAASVKLLPPPNGIYHSARPDFGIEDDLVTKGRIRAFVRSAGSPIVWAYVAFNWSKGLVFPTKQCVTLNASGVVPLVGIMPRSVYEDNKDEKVYTLARIINGYFDDELRECARAVRELGFPIMMEFGPECNGPWFQWSAARNGKDADSYGDRGVPDGAERFRDAYRHVVDIFRSEGADDVTWVFHVAAGAPRESWNDIRHYYPGDEYIDWIGASVYGRRRDGEDARHFSDLMDEIYEEMCALSETKPLAVLEIGVAERVESADKPDWIRRAYADLISGRYPRIKAVAWWNKIYRPDGSRSMLEIDSSPESLAAYRESVEPLVSSPIFSE